MRLSTLDELYTVYARPKGRTLEKEITAIDPHCAAFIAASPFVVMGTSGANGQDVTPRGDTPGFVQVEDETHLLMPDWPGNNRLDSLKNLLDNSQISLIFMIPTVAETLRVRGTATIETDPELLNRCASNGKHPISVLRITVAKAYLHCAKALMRSNLWKPEGWPTQRPVPSMGEMIRDHAASEGPVETQDQMIARYKAALY